MTSVHPACDPSELDGYSNGVVGAAGAANGNSAAGTGGADQSFAARCQHPDVIRCFGFDDNDETLDHYVPPDGVFDQRAMVDTQMKTSGRGAMRFDVPIGASQREMTGYFAINFTPGSRNLNRLSEAPAADYYNIQIGEGESFFVQWRERIEQPLIDGSYLAAPGFSLFLFSIGQGDRPDSLAESVDPLSFVLANAYYEGLVGVNQYNDPVVATVGDTTLLQNVVGCALGATNNPDCVRYLAEEWLTLQMGVTVGTWEMPNSRLEVWVGGESFPVTKIMDHKDRNLPRVSEVSRFGKVYFSLTDEGRSLDVPNNDPVIAARAWVDELIISRSRIEDP
jgi:hypothetical protein